MKNKFLVGALVIALLAAIMPFSAQKAAAGNDEDLKFDMFTGNIIGYTGTASAVDIPDKIDGVAVKGIGKRAFRGCKTLKSVTLPETITVLEEEAFAFCDNLSSINIPNGVVEIGDQAFRGCDFKKLTLPDSVTSIGIRAFCDCENLVEITLSKSLETISDSMFSNCTSLKSITLPDSVRTIEDFAFRDCKGLTYFIIPEGVRSVGTQFINGCTNIRSVAMPESLTFIDDGAFHNGGYMLKDITIYGYMDSYAYNYAGEMGIPFRLMSSFPAIAPSEPIWADASEWAAPELQAAAEAGLIPEALSGEDFTKPITRGEFAAVAVQLYEAWAGKTASVPTNCPFTDIAGDANRTAILKAYGLGVTTGVSPEIFDAATLITREQLATMLCRVYKTKEWPKWTLSTDDNFTLNYSGVEKFSDDADISEYAKPSVYFMVKYGVISGVGNNLFAPKNATPAQEATGYATATREQAVLMSLRSFENL